MKAASAYYIRNWEKHFEGSRTKDYNNKTTCQMPTKHGLGYSKMLKQKNGEAMFGAWCALIQVLSRHEKPRQGFVTDNGMLPASKEGDADGKTGKPYSFGDLELITGFSAKTFEKLLEFTSQTLDWVQVIDSLSPQCHHGDSEGAAQCPPNSDSDIDSDPDSLCSEPVPASEPLIEFPVNPKSDPNWVFTANHLDELKDAFPHIDVMSEVKAALLWIKATPSRRKTRLGMERFINGWIARTNDKGKYAEKQTNFIAATGNPLNPPWSAYKNGT